MKPIGATAPADDVDFGDDFDPTKPMKKSKVWLKLIDDYHKAGFDDYNTRSDNIDRLYANLERLAKAGRDREFQMFWANVQVVGPTIYSRPPVAVVTSRFRDRRPLYQVTSEFLERCSNVALEMGDIDYVMRLVRDDLNVLARGVPWVRYEASSKDNGFAEQVCIEHVNRKDFAHDPARNWKETGWVAKRSWMTKAAMRKRFYKHSGNEYRNATFEIRRDDDKAPDDLRKAAVWEIWSKTANRVVWVSEGVEVLLDDDEPHLKLEGFFPCPRPAYSTTERGSLKPVPDFVFYKDQLEEINELTARISALAEAVKVKGFYPAGASDLAEAVESAVKSTDNRQVLVGVSNWAAFGDLKTADVIVWLPIEMVANVIVQLVNLRRTMIDDVYQITGLSDIMRGSTDAKETATAQTIKAQYGSVRVRDRQDEMVRVARDLTRMVAEIMAENFRPKTLLEMSQMEIPSNSDIKKQIGPLEQQIRQITAQVKEAQSDPELMAQAQQRPEVLQQIMGQAQQQIQQLQGQIQKLSDTVTIEQIMDLLREQRIRPFALDIETDSTIAPDENSQKQRATEFVTAVGGLLREALPAVQQVPQSAPLMAETFKFMASQFRVGRQLDTVIDEFAEAMKSMGGQPQADPEEDAQKAAQAHQEAEAQSRAAEMQMKQQAAAADQQRKQDAAMHEREIRDRESQERIAIMQAQAGERRQKHMQDMELGNLDIKKKRLELAKLGGQIDLQQQQGEIAAETAVIKAAEADQRAEHADRSFEQNSIATEGGPA